MSSSPTVKKSPGGTGAIDKSTPTLQSTSAPGQRARGTVPIVRHYLPRVITSKAKSLDASVQKFAPKVAKISRTKTSVPTNLPRLVSASNVVGRGPSQGLPALPARLPVLLLPFRIETRFVQGVGGMELWIRVYPDQISINSLKTGLTQLEADAGSVFWNRSWTLAQTPGSDEKGPWRTIASIHGVRRAAWIVRETFPSNWPNPLPASGMAQLPAPRSGNPQIDQGPTTTASVTALPDRWTAFIYAKQPPSPIEFQFTNPVNQALAVAPDLTSQISVSSGGATISSGMKWMIDFDEAVNAGMAARISLAGTDIAASGATRIIVLGLRSSSTNPDETSVLANLLRSHHFSDGLAFIPQGAPTKNTPTSASIYKRDDPGFETSYDTELGGPLSTGNPESGGSLLASALGIEASYFDHVENADRIEARNASGMLMSLWPTTMGYYLSNMMGLQPSTIESARTFARDHVFPRGPYPALRIGTVPYGIIPVTSMTMLLTSQRRTFTPFLAPLIPLLNSAIPIWNKSVSNVPVAGPSGDPNGLLLQLLAMSASPVSYNVRMILGPQFVENFLSFFGGPVPIFGTWLQSLIGSGAQLLAQLGYAGASPFILETAPFDAAAPLSLATVYDGSPSTSEKDPLPPKYTDQNGSACNYIGWLAAADLSRVQSQALAPVPSTFLYVLLRQSLLRAAADYAVLAAAQANVSVDNQPVTFASLKETELVNFPSQPRTQRPWDILSTSIPGVTASGQSYANFLNNPSGGLTYVPPGWTDLKQSIELLSNPKLPTAELDRLLSETLSAMSSRIDPWITAVAHALLTERKQVENEPTHLGGYAWVENLIASSPMSPISPVSESGKVYSVSALAKGLSQRRGIAITPPPTIYPAPTDNAGYVLAPSVGQAATAAILRNGYVTHLQSSASSGTQPFSIDLSSHRLRTAMDILDGLRQGNSLMAILGYHFENMMHQSPVLAALISDFENAYPLVANKLTLPSGNARDVAAPNVVDGVALLADYASNSSKFQQLVSNLSGSDLITFNTLMSELQDGLGALEDVFTAETVYQIQRGNTVRAGAALSSVEQGSVPPEIEVLRTPRSGISLAHRVGIIVQSAHSSAENQPGDANPRANAEPNLHSWLRNLILDPSKVSCRYSIGPLSSDASAPPLAEITLDLLDAGPLDLVAMSLAGQTPQRSELEARILDYIYNSSESPPHSGSPPVLLVYDRSPKWRSSTFSIPEYLVVLRAFSDLLGGSRPLDPGDLSTPSTGRTVTGVGVAGNDVVQNAKNATTALQTSLADLRSARDALWTHLQTSSADASTDLKNLQDALRTVSWYNQPQAVPVDPAEARRLVPQETMSEISTKASTKTKATLAFSLRADDSLAAGTGKIVVWTAPGTNLSPKASDYQINGTNPAAVTVSSNIIQLTVAQALPASSAITITIANLVNPPSGSFSASVVTSGKSYAATDNDPVLLHLGSIAQADLVTSQFSGEPVGLPTKITNLHVAASGGAGGPPVTLTIQFRSSASGELAQGAGTISILGPGGALFSASPGDYQVQNSGATLNPKSPPQIIGNSVKITVPIDIDSQSDVTVLLKLAGPVPASSGFSVLTSADSLPSEATTTIPGGLGGGGTQLQSATVIPHPAEGTIELHCQTSDTSPPLNKDKGIVNVWVPQGMSFSQHAEDFLFSNIAHSAGQSSSVDPQTILGQISLTVPFDIYPGESVSILIRSVQSPGAGDYGLSVATSGDALPRVAQFSIPLGANEAVSALKSIFGRAFVSLPSFSPRNGGELATALSLSASLTRKDPDAVSRWIQQLTHLHPAIRRLDHALGLAKVTVLQTASTETNLLVGQLPISPNDQWVGMPSRSSVSPGAVVLDNTGSSQSANYRITLTTSGVGTLSSGDSVVITAPSGTVLPSAGSYGIVGQSSGNVSIASVSLASFMGSNTQNQATIVLDQGANIQASDILTLTISNVTNPDTASDIYVILIYTSSDPQPSPSSPYSVAGSTPAINVPTYSAGRTDLVLLVPESFDPSTLLDQGTTLCGLWVDGWAEKIPSKNETAGLAFHYAEPLTQAPQALLLAVNPTNDETWTAHGLDVLRQIVSESLDLAKVRAVDEIARADGGELIPAIYCPFNPAGDTISANLKANLTIPTVVGAAAASSSIIRSGDVSA